MMKDYFKLLGEAIIIGLCLIVIGYLVSYCIKPYFKVSLPEICNDWNKNYVFEATLFLSGFFLHILYEMTGVNHWYCNIKN